MISQEVTYEFRKIHSAPDLRCAASSNHPPEWFDFIRCPVLYFDKIRKMVGVQITKNQGDDGALKLSRRRRSVSLKAPQFFDLYGLSFEEAQRFDVGHDPDSNMLTISLKHVQRRRGRRPKKL